MCEVLIYSMEQNSQLVNKFPAFYGTQGSLRHSQMPATCPYPEPARSSTYPHIPLPEDPSSYYPPIYTRVSQVVSFPQASPPKPYVRSTTDIN